MCAGCQIMPSNTRLKKGKSRNVPFPLLWAIINDMNPELFECCGSSIEVIRACIEVSGNDEDTICRLTERGKEFSEAERTAYNSFLRVLSQPDCDEKERVWEIAGRIRDRRKRGLVWKQPGYLMHV